jgi:hypothetical protein
LAHDCRVHVCDINGDVLDAFLQSWTVECPGQ